MLSQIKSKIKQYGILNSCRKTIALCSPLCIVNDKSIRNINYQNRCKNKLTKYLTFNNFGQAASYNPYPNKIWWLWFQGIDNAPKIVKQCFLSVDKWKGNYEVVMLTKNNLFDYVHMPEMIVNKWLNGDICNAHFADICRVCLLADYGGIWIDSTVLLTGEISKEISNSDVFFYKSSFLDLSETKISNWLISAKCNNPLICSIRATLFKYWSNEVSVPDYYIFHLFVNALVEHSDELKREFEQIPYLSNTYPHLLQYKFYNDFNLKEWEHILKCSNVHKLTYKNIDRCKNHNNFLEYILDGSAL